MAGWWDWVARSLLHRQQQRVRLRAVVSTKPNSSSTAHAHTSVQIHSAGHARGAVPPHSLKPRRK